MKANSKTSKNKNHKRKKEETFKIKETKLVDLHRLRVVRDIHINGAPFNQREMEQKKKELIEHLEKNNGVYPKHEAILVWKDKDLEDKRRVVYNIEDGYRRCVLSKGLELDKVYVNIIEE